MGRQPQQMPSKCQPAQKATDHLTQDKSQSRNSGASDPGSGDPYCTRRGVVKHPLWVSQSESYTGG